MARKRRVFAERTPLGHRVVLTRDRWRVVVGGDDPQERFVVTAYLTGKIKKGRELWKK